MNTHAGPWSVSVAGANGRLGTVICEVIDELPEFTLAARLNSRSGENDGSDSDILVDVTHPDASAAIVERGMSRGQRVLVGTSGWNADRLADLEASVAETAGATVMVVPNFSIGSVLGTALSRIAAPHFDAVEIIESHHPAKVDSPSGTAVRTAEVIEDARGGIPLSPPFSEQPARGHIVAGVPVHSLRLAGVIAKQEVRFGGVGETLTITHDTQSSSSYRAGIVAALRALTTSRGLTVGLEQILGIDG